MRDLFSFPDGRRFDLLAFGDPNIDLAFTVERAPTADQKVLGRRLPPFAGGTVANVACAASLLGRPTMAYGRIAGDAEGAFLGREFERFGVALDHVRVVPGVTSPTALILIEASGEKALVYSPMPGPTLHEETCAAALAQCRLLYAMPYNLPEFERLHHLARAAGVPLAIDIEAAMVACLNELHRLLSMADLVFMNDSTYRTVIGAEPDAAGMAGLLSHGPRMLVVTCGTRGAMLSARDPELAIAQQAFPARVVDATGAGDSFNGAFLAALLEGQAPAKALRYACAAGSIAVTATGARSALPTHAQIQALLDHA
ncbi:carbohydrate kinase family protein [Oxalobacteraceae bacterium OTU3CINTB1]|nr:carbohydrate kinase family protein [Oxalobacteraceae bacterium OTU3CINTB1]